MDFRRVSPDQPTTVEVHVDGAWRAGVISAWRRDSPDQEWLALVCYLLPEGRFGELQYVDWIPASQVRRVNAP